MVASEIIFEVREDEAGGSYVARASGHSIFTQGDNLEDLRARVKDAVVFHFADPAPRPGIIRLHFVRDEVFAS